jgi:hypothetical protein
VAVSVKMRSDSGGGRRWGRCEGKRFEYSRVPLTALCEIKDEQCGLNLSSGFGWLKRKLDIKFL